MQRNYPVQENNNNNSKLPAPLDDGNNSSMVPNVAFKSAAGAEEGHASADEQSRMLAQTNNTGYSQPPPPVNSMAMNNWNGPPQGPMMPGAGGGASGGMGMGQQQQQQQIWMQRPPLVVGCPPGLEYLTMVDQVLVHQQIELLEVFTNWETKNKYQIKNSIGQQVYYAAEGVECVVSGAGDVVLVDAYPYLHRVPNVRSSQAQNNVESDVCARQCCGPQRGFVMHITDNMGNEVIRAIRDFKCCAGPCCQCCAGIPVCAQELLVESPPGQTIGRIIQQSSCLEPSYAIQNADFETMLHIRGPICICQGPCCTWDQEFKVYSSDMAAEVGRISKQWSGFVHEYFTDADNFGVSFPLDLDVKMKATMLGAVFLIDFIFFENNQQNQNN